MSSQKGSGVTTICGVLFLISLACFLTELFTNPQKFDLSGPVVVLDKPQTLSMAFGNDTVKVRLNRGDSLKILGMERFTYEQKFLVETSNGNRGWMDTYFLPVRQILIKGENAGDTITLTSQKIIGTSKNIDGYKAMLPDGTQIDTKANGFEPAIDNWTDLKFSNVIVTSTGTEKHYASLTGLSLTEIEKKIGPAFQIFRNAEGTIAQFQAMAYNPTDGKFYRPIYTFNSDGIADKVEFNYYKDRNSSILKHAPAAGFILDMKFSSLSIRTSIYEKGVVSERVAGFKRFMVYVMIVIVLAGVLVWLFATPSIPVLAMGWLIRFPKVFAALTDGALRWLMFGVSVIFTYYWLVLMLSWGMFWLFAFGVIIASWYLFRYASSELCTIPHTRCPRCHRLHTIFFDDEVLYDTRYEKGADVVRGKHLGTSFSKHTTWTDVTKITKYADGHNDTYNYRENVRRHKIRHDTYQMIDYELTYRVDYYHEHYVCDECFYEEILNSAKWTEIDRKVVGSHTDTFSHEV